MEVYEKAKEFWNKHFDDAAVKIEGKFIDNKVFNNAVMSLYDEKGYVLDFGTGSGWGIFELYFTRNFYRGYGIDQSINAINYARECAKLSGLDNIIRFECDDMSAFKDDFFDAIFSVNTLDVVPLDITKEALSQFKRVLKPNGKLLISLNPYIDNELNKRLKLDYIGENMYTRDGILRALNLTNDEWINLFSKYFKVLEVHDYELSFEKGYVRRMFILKNE